MEKDAPLVSICMPAYNAEKYILQAVNSIIEQSYQHWELVIVNDGSTDNTYNKLEKIDDKRVKIITTANQGQCAAANLAFIESSGSYVKFMDADDLISGHFIENQVKLLAGKTNKIASAAWGRFYNNDISTFKLNPESVWRDMKPIDWLVESLSTGHNMMQCALWLIPRNIVKKSGLWNERLSLINDFDFFIRILLASNNICFTNDATLYYRSGIINSLSNQKTRKALESAFESTKLGINSILRFENTERTRIVCANVMQNWAYQFYPVEFVLYKQSAKIIENLGGSNLKFHAGGKTKVLIMLVGWKFTVRLKNLLQK